MSGPNGPFVEPIMGVSLVGYSSPQFVRSGSTV